MATKKVFVVFVLPVIFSLVFASVVLSGILQKPDRELNMWPTSSTEGFSNSNPVETQIEIVGLAKQYSRAEPIEIQVKVTNPSFDCGDLYITIYSSDKNDVITQGGFFTQCFENGNNLLPVGDKFSKVVDTSGSYKITADMISKDLMNISTSETFTIK